MSSKILLAAFLLSASFSTFAAKIQILHTNDLHSYLDHADQDPERGGYGRLKAAIDRLRSEGKSQGIGTIAMDGGDFLEGSIHYMANYGRKSAQAYNMIGYDVAVLGNHDYLMGAPDLEALLEDVPPTMQLLAANLKVKRNFYHINQDIKPYWETTVSGVKVGVVGITLNEMVYKWRVKGDGKFEKYAKVARKYAKKLRKRGNEIVIALTHIGTSSDKELAKAVPELDIIVGGHDHNVIHDVIYQPSRGGKKIPIVQAGEFGEWLGQLMIDYNKETKNIKVTHRLLPVTGNEWDAAIQKLVALAEEDLNQIYGKKWLNTVVGTSSLRPRSPSTNDSLAWHLFVNDSMREAVDADFAIHAMSLSGEYPRAGNVTNRILYNGNPRHFDFEDKHGYAIYTTLIPGIFLKPFMKFCLKKNVPFYFSGLSFKWKKKVDGKFDVWDMRHNGKKLRSFKRYKVAMSEGIVRGALEISSALKFLFQAPERTEISMWKALELKFARDKTIAPDYVNTYYNKYMNETGAPFERTSLKQDP